MKKLIIVAYIMIALFLNACKHVDDVPAHIPSNTEDTETITATEAETSWQDNYEVRDTNTVVAELKEHFVENREELDKIALAMFRDSKEHPYGLCAKMGRLYTVNPSDMELDFANPIESETADLVAAYFAKGFSETQDIYIDRDLYFVRQDVCMFCYDAFLEDDGVLTEVNLMYYEEEDILTFPPAQFIDLDDHWMICVIAYPY